MLEKLDAETLKDNWEMKAGAAFATCGSRLLFEWTHGKIIPLNLV
jgi:hypothetical protein